MKFILYIQLRAYLYFPIKKHNQVIFAFSLVRQLAIVLIKSDKHPRKKLLNLTRAKFKQTLSK